MSASTNASDDASLNLDVIREQLIRQEETIIFNLIERAQWKQNNIIYVPGGTEFKPDLKNLPGDNQQSFLDFFFEETEKAHALVRRYTSPDEHPFFPKRLPEPILPLMDFPAVIKPNSVNINEKIRSLYIAEIIPSICHQGDDKQYGSTATADIAVLQALSKRIHYGKFVAEAKFLSDTETYTKLIESGDTDGIMEKLTNLQVEQQLLKRVYKKASTYGQDIGVADAEKRFKIDPSQVEDLYSKFIIPLTKEVQVKYLMERTHGPSVAFLGPLGTFSQQAALQYFVPAVNSKQYIRYEPCNTINDVFASVLSNKTVYGIVPIENSQTGIIHTHMELLTSNNTKVCGEIYVPISFCFMTNPKTITNVSNLQRVFSHSQGFEQCKNWISLNIPNAELVPVTSTAKGAEMVAEDSSGQVACIANRVAGDIYGLNIAESNIQTTSDNVTRFLIISKSFGGPSGNDKTIITFAVNNVPGALAAVLNVFAEGKLNITSIQSYPDRRSSFQYSFYVEFEGHCDTPSVKQAFTQLAQFTTFITIIGSFSKNPINK